MEWMLMPLKRYAEFSGRSRRKEYWMYILFIVIVSIVLSILDKMLGLGGGSSITPTTVDGANAMGGGLGAATHMGVLGGIFALGTFIPSLAVAIRRLHDTDRAGWWVLLGFGPYLLAVVLMVVGALTGQLGLLATGGLIMMIGFVGAIVLLVFMCLPGTSGPNKYGPDPLDPSGAELGEVFS
ncbi:MAG: DUF805 domain-containing protein [Pseudomonadota bacterium]